MWCNGDDVTNEDPLELAASADDPWAPGGAMSDVVPTPADVVFDDAPHEVPPTRTAGSPWARAPEAAPAGDLPPTDLAGDVPVDLAAARPTDLAAAGPAGHRRPPRGERPRLTPGRRVGAAVVGAALLVVAGIWTTGRDRGDGADQAADPPPTSGAATRPPPDPTLPPATTDAPATTAAPTRPAGPAEVAPASFIDGLDGAIVELPQPLRVLEHFELLVLAGDALVEVEVPTGLVRTLATGLDVANPELAATDDAAVVWSRNDNWILLVRRDAPPMEIGLGAGVTGVVAGADGEFLLLLDSGEHRRLVLDPNLWIARQEFPTGDPATARAYPGGGLMVSGQLGTYLVGTGGAQVISGGFVIAAGRNHVVTRACPNPGPREPVDEHAGDGCRLFLDHVASGTRVELDDVVSGELPPATSSYSLSPDGTALTRSEFGVGSGPAVRLIELGTGNTVDVPWDPASLPALSTWAPGSTGFLATNDGRVVYVDRVTGTMTALDWLDPVGDRVHGLIARPAPASEPQLPPEPTLVLMLTDLTGLHLVGLAQDGGVVEIDIDSRSFTTHGGPPLQSGSPVHVAATPAGVTVASWDDVPGFHLEYGSPRVPIEGDAILGPVLPGPRPGTWWHLRGFEPTGDVAVDLVTLDGSLLGSAIEVPGAELLGGDGRGGLLVAAAGGVYAATPDGAERLTTGQLLAAGPASLIARECDESLVCAVVRIDRETGERRAVDEPALEVPSGNAMSIGLVGTTMSPDGDVALVRRDRNGLGWWMIDLAAGAAVDVPGPAAGTSLVWSADSRYAAYVSGGQLQIFDRDAATLRTTRQLPALRAVVAVEHDAADVGLAGPLRLGNVTSADAPWPAPR